MKKLFMYFALALTVLAMPSLAQADTIYGWDFDLGSYGSYTGVSSIGVYGSGTITQSFGGDGKLDEGDLFDATSSIFTVSIKADSYTGPFSTGGPEQLYFISDNLKGYVTDIQPDGSFKYVYTSGDVQMRIGNVNDTSTYTLLADMKLAEGLGNAADANLIGSFLDGESDLLIRFEDNPLGSMIKFDPALYPGFGAYPNLLSYLLFDLTNSLNPNDVEFTNDGFIATVETHGPVTLVATPEPSTFLILGFGLLGLVGFRRKFRK